MGMSSFSTGDVGILCGAKRKPLKPPSKSGDAGNQGLTLMDGPHVLFIHQPGKVSPGPGQPRDGGSL